MLRRHVGFWYGLVIGVAKPLLLLFTRRDWRGAEHLPPPGTGVIVAANHISYADPFVLGHFLYDNGLLPRFLAKAELWRVPFVKWVVAGAKQIPVYRGSADAVSALSAAVEALQRGECVLVYPEGTATRDPQLWPMKAKTGVARLALHSGVPVVPVAQWGAQELLPYPSRRPRLAHRTTIRMLAGPPVDLSSYQGRDVTAQVLREVTELIMREITTLLTQLRDGTPPPTFFDSRADRGPASRSSA